MSWYLIYSMGYIH